MPSDEYSSFGKGALKLKGVGGGKVKKHKKKEKKNSPDLERALATATGEPSSQQPLSADKRRSESLAGHDGDDEDEAPVVSHKTEAERRFEEARRKKVKCHFPACRVLVSGHARH
jgi:protein FAM32A